MFSDFYWDSRRVDGQNNRFENWIHRGDKQWLVIVEIGAGLAVPTVRSTCKNLFRNWHGKVCFIQINPRDTTAVNGINVLKMSALHGIKLLDK